MLSGFCETLKKISSLPPFTNYLILCNLAVKVTDISPVNILAEPFTNNRYISLFILLLPMIGMLERIGLRERVETLTSLDRKGMDDLPDAAQSDQCRGTAFGRHPSMIRPLVAPMAEATAEEGRGPLTRVEAHH